MGKYNSAQIIDIQQLNELKPEFEKSGPWETRTFCLPKTGFGFMFLHQELRVKKFFLPLLNNSKRVFDYFGHSETTGMDFGRKMGSCRFN